MLLHWADIVKSHTLTDSEESMVQGWTVETARTTPWMRSPEALTQVVLVQFSAKVPTGQLGNMDEAVNDVPLAVHEYGLQMKLGSVPGQPGQAYPVLTHEGFPGASRLARLWAFGLEAEEARIPYHIVTTDVVVGDWGSPSLCKGQHQGRTSMIRGGWSWKTWGRENAAAVCMGRCRDLQHPLSSSRLVPP